MQGRKCEKKKKSITVNKILIRRDDKLCKAY